MAAQQQNMPPLECINCFKTTDINVTLTLPPWGGGGGGGEGGGGGPCSLVPVKFSLCCLKCMSLILFPNIHFVSVFRSLSFIFLLFLCS